MNYQRLKPDIAATHVPDVARSKDEFLAENPDWLTFDLAHGVSLLERHEKLE